MNESKNLIITYCCLGLMAIAFVFSKTSTESLSAIAQNNTGPTNTETITTPGTNPRLLKLNLSLSTPTDLKVKAGESVSTGQVLVEKTEIKKGLLEGRNQLVLNRDAIANRQVITPVPPNRVPAVDRLPITSYAEPEAQINAAAIKIEQYTRAIALQQQQMSADPPSFSAALMAARDAVANQQRLIDNQKRKIEAVALLKDLPPEVGLHEAEVLKKLEAQLQKLAGDYEVKSGDLENAKLQRIEKLQLLQESLNKVRTDHQVAIAQLQAAKDARAYQEYQASIAAAARVEQSNQALSSYQQQLIAADGQKREQAFQIATINTKIGEIDEKIANLGVVTSPYTGTIRRIKWLGQSDRFLNVELTLVVNPSTGSNSSTNITPNGTSNTGG